MKTARVSDVVNDCACTLDFLAYCFSQVPPQEHPQSMSYSEQAGLSLILGNMSNCLTNAGLAISENKLEMEV